jgi:hypothetical protein
MTKKKDSVANELTSPPNRTEPHRIDTQAVRVVRTKLTPDWLERGAEDRDYGIDMMLEAFDGNRPTGVLILFQIKGHAASFEQEISMAVPVKTLLYARMFQTPFFLLTVSVADNRAHFVWLQKYINTRLAIEHKRWERQEHVTVHFPRDNVLDESGLKKIRSLVTYTAHRDAGFSFLANLIWLRRYIEEFDSGAGKPALEQALLHLKEIERLDEFLQAYEDQVEGLDLELLRKTLEKAKSYGHYDYGDDEVVNDEMTKLSQIELMFLSRDEVDAFVSENSDEDLPY